jgi:hypothetical protein
MKPPPRDRWSTGWPTANCDHNEKPASQKHKFSKHTVEGIEPLFPIRFWSK